MVTLLASIAGFFTSLAPEILKIFKDQHDKKHELEIFDRQIEFSKLKSASSLEEISIGQEILESAALYTTYKTGVGWVDALNGTVRPVLAYSFFIMYSSVKYIQYKSISNAALVVEYLDVLWSIDDQAIFAGIISFYFGQRTFAKLRKK